MNNIKLGLGTAPERMHIYVGQDDADPSSLWYTIDFNNNNARIPLHDDALTGYLAGLRIVNDKEFRGKPTPKLDIFVRADRPYIIRSGMDTKFTRGLVLALSSLNTDELRQVLTIAVTPGREPKVVFARLYRAESSSSLVTADWDGGADLEALITRIQNIVGSGHIAGLMEPPSPARNGAHATAEHVDDIDFEPHVDCPTDAIYIRPTNSGTRETTEKMIVESQIVQLGKIVTQRSWTQQRLDAEATQRFKWPARDLTMREASQLIRELSKR